MEARSRPGRGRDSTPRCPLVIVSALLVLAVTHDAKARCDNAGRGQACGYAGASVRSGRMYTRIVDIDGFANGGRPGAGLDDDDVEIVGGRLVARHFDVRRATVFATGALAVAAIADSVTDIDLSRSRPSRIYLHDSFHDVSTDIGRLVRTGVKASLILDRALGLVRLAVVYRFAL